MIENTRHNDDFSDTIETNDLGDASVVEAAPSKIQNLKKNSPNRQSRADSRGDVVMEQRVHARSEGRASEERESPSEDARHLDEILGRLTQNVLPHLTLKEPEEYHLLWASVAPDTGESLWDYMERGYQLVRPEDVLERNIKHLISESQEFESKMIRRREMVLLKLDRRIYNAIMDKLHHENPAEQQEALFSTNRSKDFESNLAGVKDGYEFRRKQGIVGLIPGGKQVGTSSVAKEFYAPDEWD